ncbi:unnamed protein product [Paramecium octaurelia]|uniref:Uncharacterized protein n=1 Tax=Paramecium octaurelia TaxID=43137 RepID=A0A8S1SUL7_PAROT|nr:unnamed protein product [Paramecium octaurelia]
MISQQFKEIQYIQNSPEKLNQIEAQINCIKSPAEKLNN